jgi:hypothetical protein
MKALLVALGLVLAMAACSSPGSIHLIAANQLPPDLYGKPKQGSARTQQVIVYFIRGNQLVQQTRTGSSSLTLAQQAMRELLKGPTAEEQADGLSTAIPSDTALLGVDVDSSGVATVNLSQEFDQAAEQKVHVFRLAQVVYTLTELPNVDAVRFRIEGDPQPVIDQDGLPNPIVGRAKYSRLQPQESPTPVDPCTLVDSLGNCQPPTTAAAR